MTRREVVRAMRAREDFRKRLARRIYTAKAKQYRQTLHELATRYGEDARREVHLSPQIRRELQREADAHSRSIVRTWNRMLENAARRNRHLSPEDLAPRLRDVMRQRAVNRGRVIAEAETATPKLDAMVSFMRENGVEPDFEFAGPPAICALCKTLKAEQPFGIETVIAIGYPHINCRHTWRPRWPARSKLPDKLSVGQGKIAGIVGGEPLTNRAGGPDEAAVSVRAGLTR